MKRLVIGVILLMTSVGFSHGMDKPGPHGGYIQMPGAFHTEVVPDKDGSFHIYLLDTEFKNATVADSEIRAWLVSGKKKSPLKCEIMEPNHFHCLPSDKGFQGQELIVKAMREKMLGNEAKYKLPLHR